MPDLGTYRHGVGEEERKYIRKERGTRDRERTTKAITQ